MAFIICFVLYLAIAAFWSGRKPQAKRPVRDSIPCIGEEL